MISPQGRYGVYREALDTYGVYHQTMMAFEEMAELMKELSKSLRGADNVESIAEEIADVQIMLDQIMMLHGCDGLVANYKTAKIERLAARLKEEQHA